MTLFSSRPPFNDDPEPYLNPTCPDHAVCRRKEDWPEYYEPRPEYDRPQHNPTNRLLIVARRAQRGGYLLEFATGFIKEPHIEHAEVRHAQKVLSKWKAVFG